MGAITHTPKKKKKRKNHGEGNHWFMVVTVSSFIEKLGFPSGIEK